jgi:hypothetical protein
VDFDFDFFPLAETPTAWETVRRKAKDAQREGFMSESSGQRGTFPFCWFIWLVIDMVKLVCTESKSIRYFDGLYVLNWSWAVRSAVITLTLVIVICPGSPKARRKTKTKFVVNYGSGRKVSRELSFFSKKELRCFGKEACQACVNLERLRAGRAIAFFTAAWNVLAAWVRV